MQINFKIFTVSREKLGKFLHVLKNSKIIHWITEAYWKNGKGKGGLSRTEKEEVRRERKGEIGEMSIAMIRVKKETAYVIRERGDQENGSWMMKLQSFTFNEAFSPVTRILFPTSGVQEV